MIESVFSYWLILGALAGLAALGFERIAIEYGKPSRWIWLTAALATVAAPLVVGLAAPAPPALAVAVGGSAAAIGSGSGAVGSSPAGVTPVAVFVGLWALASLVVTAGLGLAWLRLLGARRSWGSAEVEGIAVRISRDFGPALVGLLRPEVVLPQDVLDSAPERRRLVVAHEVEHRRAGDGWSIAFGAVLVALVPWHLPVVWMVLRLRRAIEVDCDRRVLGRGVSRRSYGAALVEVAARARPTRMPVAAMAEPRSFLERRIALLGRGGSVRGRRVATAAALASMILVAGACSLPAPDEDLGSTVVQTLETARLAVSEHVALERLRLAERRLAKARLDFELARDRTSGADAVTAAELETLERAVESAKRAVTLARERLEKIQRARSGGGRHRVELQGSVVKLDLAFGYEQAVERMRAAEVLRAAELEAAGVARARVDDEGAEGSTAFEVRRPSKISRRVEIRPEIKARFRFSEEGSTAQTSPPETARGETPAPLYRIGTRFVTLEMVQAIDRDRIDRVDVTKGPAAVELFGEIARGGVVTIHLKEDEGSN